MNKQTVFFTTLCILNMFIFAGEPDKQEINFGHVLPEMSPRTCQNYLNWINRRQNKRQDKSPDRTRRYPLSCSNEIPLRQSSGSISK